MVELTADSMPVHPLRVTAVLRHGVVMDRRGGIALDGLLASAVRTHAAAGRRASVIDGGQRGAQVHEWPLPLARCEMAGVTDWHWLCTQARPLGANGEPIVDDPEIHYMLQRARVDRWRHAAVRVPARVPHTKGRYQNRITPMVVLPAAVLEWLAVGNRDRVADLVATVHNVGGQRGTGEGVVDEWVVTRVQNPELHHGHLHQDGLPGRPLLPECWDACGLPDFHTVTAGLRPPLWHPAMQHAMCILREPYE